MGKAPSKTPNKTLRFVLPYEPQYTGHWTSNRQPGDMEERPRRREREVASPSIAPEHVRDEEKIK